MPFVPLPSPPPPIVSPSPLASVILGPSPRGTPAPGLTPLPATTPSPSFSPRPLVTGALVLGKTRLQLNVGATSAPISITGGVLPLRAVLSAPIADVRIDPNTDSLVVRGRANGTATVTVTDANGATATASLLVGPNAGFAPNELSLTLTGNPTSDFVVSQIHAALLRAVAPLPAAIVVPGSVSVPASFAPGDSIAAPVRFHVNGVNRYVDVDGVASVDISVVPPTAVPPTVLFYSDDPEELTQDGVLFRGTVSREQPVRLYYYHQTKVPNESVDIALEAQGQPATINVIGRGAGPNPAIMYVGQSATYRFLDDNARSAGVNLDVASGAPLMIYTSDIPMKTGDLVAGAVDFAVTSGGPVLVTVLARSEAADLTSLLSGDELLSDGRRRRGAYDIAQPFSLALAYAVGGPEPTPVDVGAGDPPIPNLRPGGRALAGDYGILRNVNLQLSNPTQSPATVYLYEKPIGYPVTTTIDFTGDPAPQRLQCAKQPVRYLVRAFDVQANATTTITGTYMTDGGSTYPLTFGLTSTPPSPLPLTMTAPDGCFPKPPSAAPSPTPSATPSPSPSASPSASPGDATVANRR